MSIVTNMRGLKRREFIRGILALGVASVVGGLGLLAQVKPVFANPARGQIIIISPPGNNGSQPGAGLISPRNSSGALTGPPYHVFQTPGDVVPGQVLFEGLDVTYTEITGNQATAVQRDVA